MNLGNLNVFSAFSRRMDWLGDRQRVLAQNVANANTPDYAARDVKALSFRSMLNPQASARVDLASTDPTHRAGRQTRSPHGERDVRDANIVTLSGNAVELETEMEKVAETAMDYQTMTNLYRRHVDMLKTAIGRGGAV